MDRNSGQKRAVHHLYPPVEPFDQSHLDVGDGHIIYYEQSGNPNGVPVIIVHGGPGGGCSPAMRRYFNPKIYRIVLFDQRGCGRSRPHASIVANTTWHLVSDMERIRTEIDVDDWIVFGGSWGATLSLLYAQRHPEHAKCLVLRGVFLMRQSELDWFYGGGAGQFWPEPWKAFSNLIPQEERGDLITAFQKRLFSGDWQTEVTSAKAWAKWENALASINSNGVGGETSAEYARAFSRLENHYFYNKGFLDNDNQILSNMNRIQHIPGYIVQGRYDMICPPRSAFDLAESWPRSELRIIRDAGHALSEPGISEELVQIMDDLARA
ncbi:prolyl aminopeptidase [Pseudopelagicola sp. nBUS_19]|uniref:prolyl aminopeptidase n=1 Tax=Pseudopelagicola sp. nBUS_19 TaxID=3395316 RepID=UPI003EBF77AF